MKRNNINYKTYYEDEFIEEEIKEIKEEIFLIDEYIKKNGQNV